MVRTGRPPKGIKTVKRTFKITPEQDKALNTMLDGYKLTHGLEDRSNIVRLALENYFNEFYEYAN